MDTPFTKWLIDQMNKTGWSQADLARHTGLTRQAIANYVDGRAPQPDSIVILARVFKFPPEALFRIAQGIQDQDADPWVDEMTHKLKLLPQGMRGVAGRFIESMLEGEEIPQPKVKPKPKPKPRSSAL